MAVFQLAYSEGDPLVIEADDFAECVVKFVQHLQAEAEQDGSYTVDGCERWIDHINKLSDEEVIR